MAAFDLPRQLSASKLRRIRAVATKQKLFLAARDAEPLKMIQSQLAMLTSALDNVIHYIYASHMSPFAAFGGGLDPAAPLFVSAEKSMQEMENPDTMSEASQHINDHRLHSESFHDYASEAPKLQGVWEPVDPWLFLDTKELAHISQTCRASLDLISANTSFFSVSAEPGNNESDVTACGKPREESSDSESVDMRADFESFVDNTIICFADELQKSMRTGCLDMIKDAFRQGFSAEAISNQFGDICRPKVCEQAAQVASKVQQRWPQLADSIDLEARMATCLQAAILDWMSEALTSNSDQSSQGPP